MDLADAPALVALLNDLGRGLVTALVLAAWTRFLGDQRHREGKQELELDAERLRQDEKRLELDERRLRLDRAPTAG